MYINKHIKTAFERSEYSKIDPNDCKKINNWFSTLDNVALEFSDPKFEYCAITQRNCDCLWVHLVSLETLNLDGNFII